MPAVPALRAGDADRERAVALLRDAAVEGRLTLEEFSERVERALQARTHDELRALGADLGGTLVPPPVPQQKAGRWVVTSMMERRGRWRLPPAYRINVLCGTVLLDLGQAVVESSVSTLEVRNICATVTILVPEAVQVEIDDGGFCLTHNVTLPEQPAPAGAPLIRIRTSGACGTNIIRSTGDGDAT